MRLFIAISALVAIVASAASAQETPRTIKAQDIAWKSHPLFKGVQIAVLIGAPDKAGLVVQRLKFSAHTKVPPHYHSYAEVVTVISGRVGIGLKDNFEPARDRMLEAGSVVFVPAKQPHFAWTEDGEAVLQTQFVGPANSVVMTGKAAE